MYVWNFHSNSSICWFLDGPLLCMGVRKRIGKQQQPQHPCDYCDHQSTNKSILNAHKKKKHTAWCPIVIQPGFSTLIFCNKWTRVAFQISLIHGAILVGIYKIFSIFPIYALPLWLIPIFPGLCSFEMLNKEREYDCIEVRKMLSAILLAGKSPCWCHPASHPGVLIAGSWCKRWAGRLGPDSRLTHGPHVGHAAANTFALKH